MKVFFPYLLALFALLLICSLTACSTKCAFTLTGTWHATATYEQELSENVDSALPAAVAYIQQENTFCFSGDGSYTRTISARCVDAQSFVPAVSDAAIAALYQAAETTVTLSRTYTFTRNTLVLTAAYAHIEESAEPVPYEAFYAITSAFGAPVVKAKLEAMTENSFVLQGFRFVRIEGE